MTEITLHIGETDSYHTIYLDCLQHDGTRKTTEVEIHVLPQDRPRVFEVKIDGEFVYLSDAGSKKEIIAKTTGYSRAVEEWVKDGDGIPKAIINLKRDEQGGFLIPNSVRFVPKPGFVNFVRRIFHIGGWKELNLHDQLLTLAKQAKVIRGDQ